MRSRRIQNIVAESGLTLPAFSIFALCLWCPWTFATEPFDAFAPLLLLLTCYVLMEWCNRCQIIRIRSRLTTSLFVLGASVICTAFPGFDWTCIVPSLGVVCCMFAMSSTYDNREPVVKVLHASFALSAASVLCPPLLLLWPVLLFCLAAYMRVFSLRVFSASLMGLLLPWLFIGTWWIIDSSGLLPIDLPSLLPPPSSLLPSPLSLFSSLSSLFPSPSSLLPSPCSLLPYLAVTFLSLVSLFHFLGNSYDDKIRVRMIFHAIICFWLALQVAIILFPHCLNMLLPALWAVGSPLLSHHFGLSSSRLTMSWFFFTMLLLFGGSLYRFL